MSAKGILTPVIPLSDEPGTTLLETERLLIRRSAPSDAAALAAVANNPRIAGMMSDRFPHPYTLADAEDFLKIACKRDGTLYPCNTAIILKPNTPANSSDEYVYAGGIGIMAEGDVFYRTWEMGYWLASPHWGKGLMTEAASAFVRWLFATWPALQRLQADAYSVNSASQNVIKKLGFVEESRLKDAVEKNGVTMDLVRFRLLRSEYENKAKAA
ncbi:acyl-CoA N-acyltransferase [Mariannaea sp. PMI_226]|nr:acyl-CoA N-acyltransferase [Mariannaea sp. PMI_226]